MCRDQDPRGCPTVDIQNQGFRALGFWGLGLRVSGFGFRDSTRKLEKHMEREVEHRMDNGNIFRSILYRVGIQNSAWPYPVNRKPQTQNPQNPNCPNPLG